MMTRRDLLQRSSLLTLAPMLPGFLARTAMAARPERDGRIAGRRPARRGQRRDQYGRPVPRRGVSPASSRFAARHREALQADRSRSGSTRRCERAADMVQDGRLAIVQGVGYPNPDRSHFHSMAIWQTGAAGGPGAGNPRVARIRGSTVPTRRRDPRPCSSAIARSLGPCAAAGRHRRVRRRRPTWRWPSQRPLVLRRPRRARRNSRPSSIAPSPAAMRLPRAGGRRRSGRPRPGRAIRTASSASTWSWSRDRSRPGWRPASTTSSSPVTTPIRPVAGTGKAAG